MTDLCPTFVLPEKYPNGVDADTPMGYCWGMWVSVAELPEFVSRAEKRMTEEERHALIDYLARNPKAGDVIRGTGGIRKLRWAVGGRGKSGGVRVIYYFYDESLPIFLFTVFAKNEKVSLNQSENNELRQLVAAIVKEHKAKRRAQ